MASSATTIAPYIGQALPAKIIRVADTTLFRVAALQLGDATEWYRIAALNSINDPWIVQPTDLAIPQKGPSNGGIPVYG